MSSEISAATDGPKSPDTSTYYFYITNNNIVDVVIQKPDGSKTTLEPEGTFGAYGNGTYQVLAPGSPDVIYFTLTYKDYDNMSTQKGPLNGKFTLKVDMR